MDTSGLPTAARLKANSLGRVTGSLAAGLVALVLLAGGCATGPVELGRPLPTDRLAQLKPGVSTMSEVLATLGEPQGRGKGLLPSAPPIDLLFYESDTMEGTKMRMKMLIVFMNRSTGVFDGYMWFNSGLMLSPGN